MIEAMSAEQAGELLKAIYAYQISGEEPSNDNPIYLVFCLIKAKFDEDQAAYEKECEKNRTNGKKGGRPKTQHNPNKPKQTQTNPKNPVGFSKTKPNPKNPDTDTDTDTETDTEKDIDTEKTKTPLTPRKTQASIVEESELSPAVKEKLLEWLKYKTERREGYKETGLRNLITTVGKKEREYGSTAVIDLMAECMSNQWQGIIWDRIKKPPNRESTDVTSSWLQNRHKWGET